MIPLRDINPTRTFPLITILIIVANALVFLYELTLSPSQLTRFIAEYGTVPYQITHGVALDPAFTLPVYLTLFTAMFLHGGWLHIIGNMLYFWIFGNNIEDRFGHLRFLLIYLFWGVAAGLVQVFVDPNSRVPALGASGAIAGVLGAYLVIFPHRTRRHAHSARLLSDDAATARAVRHRPVDPASVPQRVFGGRRGPLDGGVAYFAHIGGAVVGLITGLLYRVLVPRRTFDTLGGGL